MSDLPLNRSQQRALLAYLAPGRSRATTTNDALRQDKVWTTPDGTQLELDTMTPRQLVDMVEQLITQVDELKFNDDISLMFWPWPDFWDDHDAAVEEIARQLAMPAMDWLQTQPLVKRAVVLAAEYRTPVPLDF